MSGMGPASDIETMSAAAAAQASDAKALPFADGRGSGADAPEAAPESAPAKSAPAPAATAHEAAPAASIASDASVGSKKTSADAAGSLSKAGAHRSEGASEATQSRTAASVAAPEKTKPHTATLGQPAAMSAAPSPAGSIGGALVALVLVIGLILALAWVARRMPGLRGSAGQGALRVVGSLSLGPRERVVVVAVGDTQLVVGVGAGGVRTLHALAEPLPAPSAPAAAPAFAQLLAQHFGKKA